MMGWILFLITLLWASVATFYVIRFAGYLMDKEDTLSEAIDVHERSIAVFDGLLKMRLFFDSPEVKAALIEALEDVKVCKVATLKVAEDFTRLSKHKYIIRRGSKDIDREESEE